MSIEHINYYYFCFYFSASLHTSVSLPNVHHFERPGQQPRYRLPNPAVPSHSLLMNYIAAVIPAKWRAVGTQLNLSIGRLDQIEHDHSKADRCFSEVFALWERQSNDAAPYEWSSLYEALRSPQVSENKLANDVELIISATTSNTRYADLVKLSFVSYSPFFLPL